MPPAHRNAAYETSRNFCFLPVALVHKHPRLSKHVVTWPLDSEKGNVPALQATGPRPLAAPTPAPRAHKGRHVAVEAEGTQGGQPETATLTAMGPLRGGDSLVPAESSSTQDPQTPPKLQAASPANGLGKWGRCPFQSEHTGRQLRPSQLEPLKRDPMPPGSVPGSAPRYPGQQGGWGVGGEDESAPGPWQAPARSPPALADAWSRAQAKAAVWALGLPRSLRPFPRRSAHPVLRNDQLLSRLPHWLCLHLAPASGTLPLSAFL